MVNMKMHVIYRCCEQGNSCGVQRPPRFDKRKCFESLVREFSDGLTQCEIDLTVVFDGPGGPLWDYVSMRLDKNIGAKAKIVGIALKNNDASLKFCYDIASADTSSDFFYFIEDDYIHRHDWLTALVSACEVLPVDNSVMTLWDHPDRYTRNDDITVGNESILCSRHGYWRTGESTTCTNIVSRRVWKEHADVFCRYLTRDREMFRTLIARGIRLWQPIPGFSQHEMIHVMSPFVRWDIVASEIKLLE